MTYFLFTSPILLKYQYFMKCWTEFSQVQSEWSANGVVLNSCHFLFTNWPPRMAASAVNNNSENIKQTISHELLKGVCQNMCHTDAFTEFLMWRHKVGATYQSAEFVLGLMAHWEFQQFRLIGNIFWKVFQQWISNFCSWLEITCQLTA